MPQLTAANLHKHYRLGDEDLHVLRGVDLTIHDREWLTIVGRSGSGKSTLLHLLGGLDRPDEGTLQFDDQQVFRLRGAKLDRYRNRHVGFVFQFYHLLPELTALENVLVGAMVGRSLFSWTRERRRMRARATRLVERVGLGDRLAQRPNKLSGGERQRIAIARALINQPAVLLADEPTGNLDDQTARNIIDLFASLHREGQSIVMVTHESHIAHAADRTVTLSDGRLETTVDE